MYPLKKAFFVLLILVLAAAACSAPAEEDAPAPTEMPTSLPAPTATTEPTPAPTPTTPVDDTGSGDDDAAPPEDSGNGDESAAADGLDPCLYGLWTVDNDSMAQYLETALNQHNAATLFDITEITGLMQISFNSAGEMALSSDDYNIQIGIALSEQVSIDMEMVLIADGVAEYQADGTHLTSKYADFVVGGIPIESVLQAVGSGGSSIAISVSPDWFLGAITEEVDDNGAGVYTCSDTTLTLQTNEYGAISLTRTQ